MSDRLRRGITFEMLQQAAAALDPLIPGQARQVDWQEFRNKLQAFGVFEYVESTLQLSFLSDLSLPDLVEKTRVLDPYMAVWATEGIGHYYTERYWAQKRVPRNLLTAESLDALPPSSLITLHAGMGLSFARHLLNTLAPRSTRSDIRRVLHQFLTLCHENSRPGYTEITIEALGLVGRTLYPHLVPIIDQELSSDLDVLGFFWHGVGRGLYFLPVNFVPYPGSTGRAVDMAQQEPPHRLGRLNALAGLAWPLTLVNIRHPHIMETFLKTHQAVVSINDAFAQGVSTAILTWHDSTPGDPDLQRFCQHQPDPSDPLLVRLWKTQVRTPCDIAMRQHYEALRETQRLGALFRYQSLSHVVDQLQREFQ